MYDGYNYVMAKPRPRGGSSSWSSPSRSRSCWSRSTSTRRRVPARRPSRTQQFGTRTGVGSPGWPRGTRKVTTASWLTPALVRVVLRGDGLSGFETPDATDILRQPRVPPCWAPYGPLFELRQVRDLHPAELWPARRRYTVRDWDPGAGSLTLDFVVHGDDGVGGPGRGSRLRATCWSSRSRWRLRARPGRRLAPAGRRRVRPPAIAASLEAVPVGRTAVALLVVDGPAHRTTRSTSPARATSPCGGCTAPVAPTTPPCSCGRSRIPRLPRRSRPHLRPRRGRRDPRRTPAPARRAGARPQRHVLLAVLAANDRRGLAQGQARLRRRDGRRLPEASGKSPATGPSPARAGPLASPPWSDPRLVRAAGGACASETSDARCSTWWERLVGPDHLVAAPRLRGHQRRPGVPGRGAGGRHRDRPARLPGRAGRAPRVDRRDPARSARAGRRRGVGGLLRPLRPHGG